MLRSVFTGISVEASGPSPISEPLSGLSPQPGVLRAGPVTGLQIGYETRAEPLSLRLASHIDIHGKSSNWRKGETPTSSRGRTGIRGE